MESLGNFFIEGANFVWGLPLLIILMGGGVFFTFYARLEPLKHFGHAIEVLRGKHDKEGEEGEISHFEALSGHLAATIGMGNISGVAVAIATGGPGAIFWMWVSAFFGITTKFFTCSLAVMYRGKDTNGETQGGPMYVIMEGLGKQWKPLAISFAVFGFFGMTPIFQANQIVQVFNDVVLVPNGLISENQLYSNLVLGVIIAVLVGLVIFGGIKRIGAVAGKMVPAMLVLYVSSVIYILIANFTEILPTLSLIISDAFTAEAAMGGAVGALIIAGARRAAFSNEAGIGTAPMMHGAAKTDEPIKEGLVAMLGPVIDTMIVCTMTGLAILITGVWKSEDLNGISLTVSAFASEIPYVGSYILVLCVLIFAFTTLFGLAYYGKKCLSFLIGAKYAFLFDYWYLVLILIGSVSTLAVVVSFVDMMYGLMAVPTMISAFLLAPKVKAAAKVYFEKIKH
uniref:alanine/glycine:cation symporter family protein n=1 Tax=Fulvivirga sp. TaxID=1931237 RepID=UPI00404B232B